MSAGCLRSDAATSARSLCGLGRMCVTRSFTPPTVLRTMSSPSLPSSLLPRTAVTGASARNARRTCPPPTSPGGAMGATSPRSARRPGSPPVSPAWTMWSTLAKTSATRGCTRPCVSEMMPMRLLDTELLHDDSEVALVEPTAADRHRLRPLSAVQLPRLRHDRRQEKPRAGRAAEEPPFDAVHRDPQLRQLVRERQQLSEHRRLHVHLGPQQRRGRNRKRLAK